MFKRTMGLNVLGVSCDALLGLGIIIDVDILKCISQCSKSIFVLVIFMMLLRHDEFLMISLRYLQDSLSGPGVKLLLYL